MGLDRNTLIGLSLIGVLMLGMFYFNSRDQLAFEANQKRVTDSINLVKRQIAIKDSLIALKNAPKIDSNVKAAPVNVFQKQPNSVEQLSVLENEVVKITFTNKGGQPKSVELKKYKTFDDKPVVLLGDDFSKISYPIVSGSGSEETSNLTFTTGAITNNPDKSQSLIFSIKDSSGKEINHQFTLRPNDYLLDFSIALNGADKLFTQGILNLWWQNQATQVEKDITFEKRQLQIGHIEDSKYDFETVTNNNDKSFDKPIDWISVKQQFFITALADKDKFQNADIKWEIPGPDDTGKAMIRSTANFHISLNGSNATVPLQLYYGPSDYAILSKYSNGMNQIVPYGSGLFAFVKYINRYVLLPVFDFIKDHVVNMGIVILLLTLFIRLLTSPILYKSYVSGAKMKALKPEIDKLKEKHGEDKQAFSMDQMKLWKSAGVSPLGGCLPALLQVPIFMSLYYFFQSNIDLRGQGFLWAKDLAAYDSIAKLPFTIPAYGDHISLFTLTAVATSLLISIYSMSTMQDNSNPVMKYMPYIFPVLLLGVFNRLPAALTWYYTISNTITLALQIVIQKYIIDHDKILAQIDANRKKPVKMSKLQQRIQEMQENNKKTQEGLKRRT